MTVYMYDALPNIDTVKFFYICGSSLQTFFISLYLLCAMPILKAITTFEWLSNQKGHEFERCHALNMFMSAVI